MTRRAKDVNLHLFEGNNSHLTKEEIEHREKTRVNLGDNNFRCTPIIRQNKVALRKWNELIKEFKADEKKSVTSADTGIIERYCMLHVFLQEAYKLRKQRVTYSTGQTELFTEGLVIKTDMKDYLDINNTIIKLSSEMKSLEDRIFINPLARLKNIAAKPDQDVDEPLKNKGFANI